MRPNISTGDAIKELVEIYRQVETEYATARHEHYAADSSSMAKRIGDLVTALRRRMDALNLAIQALQAIEKIAGLK